MCMAEKTNGLSCEATEKIEDLFKKNENIKVVGLLDIYRKKTKDNSQNAQPNTCNPSIEDV